MDCLFFAYAARLQADIVLDGESIESKDVLAEETGDSVVFFRLEGGKFVTKHAVGRRYKVQASTPEQRRMLGRRLEESWLDSRSGGR